MKQHQNLTKSLEKLVETHSISTKDREKALLYSKKIIYQASLANIRIITFLDKEYPPNLEIIPNPPFVLYVKGNSTLLTKPGIAVIGSRKITPQESKFGNTIEKIIASLNTVVISGLALGSDTSAHQGCLDSKGLTIAVLAHGLNMIYPSQNSTLAKNIVDNNGCLVSEYPPLFTPKPWSFVQRNRIIIGLSQRTIVLSATMKSGTMSAVKFIHKKPLAIVDINKSGNKHLIKSNFKIDTNHLNRDVKRFCSQQNSFLGLGLFSGFLFYKGVKRLKPDNDDDSIKPIIKRKT